MDGASNQNFHLFTTVENDFFPFSSFQNILHPATPEQLFPPLLSRETPQHNQHPSTTTPLLPVVSRNDSLSDHSLFDQTVIGSNENSLQPSPPLANPSASTPPKMHWIPPTHPAQTLATHKFPPLPATTQPPHPTQTDPDFDLSQFINNFLGSDDLMENVPPLTAVAPLLTHDTLPLLHSNILTDTPTDHHHQQQQQQQQQQLRLPPDPHTPQQVRFALPGPSASSTPQPPHKTPNPNPTPPLPPSTNPTPEKTTPARRTDKRKPRTYSQAVPSQHCHICSRRPTEGSPHQVCGNLRFGKCRKTICTKCFHQFRWDLQAARDAPPGAWKCPHCLGRCPQRAQCVIYNRTSDRRRLKLINHRKRKREGENGAPDKEGPEKKKQVRQRDGSPDSGMTTKDVTMTAVGEQCEAPTGGGKTAAAATKVKKKTKGGKSVGAKGKERVVKQAEKVGPSNPNGMGSCANEQQVAHGTNLTPAGGLGLGLGSGGSIGRGPFFLDLTLGTVGSGPLAGGVPQMMQGGSMPYVAGELRRNPEPVALENLRELAEKPTERGAWDVTEPQVGLENVSEVAEKAIEWKSVKEGGENRIEWNNGKEGGEQPLEWSHVKEVTEEKWKNAAVVEQALEWKNVEVGEQAIEWKNAKVVTEQATKLKSVKETLSDQGGKGNKEAAVGLEEEEQGNGIGSSEVCNVELVSVMEENGKVGNCNLGEELDNGNIRIDELWPDDLNGLGGGDETWIFGGSGIDVVGGGEEDSLLGMMENVAERGAEL